VLGGWHPSSLFAVIGSPPSRNDLPETTV
jgi:hypothetical protein